MTSLPRWLGLLALLWLLAGGAHAQSVESVLSPGPISKAHLKWEESCKSCHVPFDRKAQERLCADCHKEIARDLAERSGLHGRQKPQPCRSCHTEHRGREMRIAEFDRRAFDHQQTDYALRGKHREADCAKCHPAERKFSAAPHDCQSCHRKDDVHKGALGAKCENCHEEKSWRETRFDHSSTRFALTGAHLPARCESCHKTREYKDTPQTCIGCHRKDDKHKSQFGEKCESCHGTQRWRDVSFRHEVDTRYALRDKHRELRCTSCHTGQLYRDKLGSACSACHVKDDRHKGSLGKDCQNCHSERGWKEALRFDHDRSNFPLLGRHAKTACKSCHQSAVFREAPSACVACHRKDDKHQATLGEACADCHTETDWKAARFEHGRTRFPLRGAHAAATLKCSACHADLRSFRNTAQDCLSCHRKDDKHEGQLGARCDDCHNERAWKGTRFDHAKARFALSGAHVVAACKSCHQSARFRDAPRDCAGCHLKDDKHKASLGAACEGCHNTRAWRLWRFDHARQTKFPLLDAHAKLRCDSCHNKSAPTGAKIAPLQSDCVACHAKDDVHDRAFGQRCEQCHQPTRWPLILNNNKNRPALPQPGGAPS